MAGWDATSPTIYIYKHGRVCMYLATIGESYSMNMEFTTFAKISVDQALLSSRHKGTKALANILANTRYGYIIATTQMEGQPKPPFNCIESITKV